MLIALTAATVHQAIFSEPEAPLDNYREFMMLTAVQSEFFRPDNLSVKTRTQRTRRSTARAVDMWISTNSAVHRSAADVIGGMLEQLIRMTVASIRGYVDILEVAADSIARDFLEVVIRERSAQCQSLRIAYKQITQRNCVPDADQHSLEEPGAAELHVMWLRAAWSLERAELGRFLDYADAAETMLEDALLAAAANLPHGKLTRQFQDDAIAVCGCRQRLEELASELKSNRCVPRE